MVTLVIEGSGGSHLTYEIAKPVIAIGAASENDVVVRQPGVAPRHLVIQRNEGVFTFLTQPRQVVVLNGERRSRGVLKVGDRLRLGTVALLFKGVGDAPVEDETTSSAADGPPTGEPVAGSGGRGSGRRSEVVLYSEPSRLAEARERMVGLFRARLGSDVVSQLRKLLGDLFPQRQSMLASLDDAGAFKPLASQWSGELPRLPARTFDELDGSGRYAVIHLGSRRVLLNPVGSGVFQRRIFLLAETDSDHQDDDVVILSELARLVAVQWERVENSSLVHEPWEEETKTTIEQHLPGTSNPVRVLREHTLQAARSAQPALLCGRPGSGRTSLAALIATLHPSGPQRLEVFNVRDDEAAVRAELFGTQADGGAGAVDRARGGTLVLRDVDRLPVPLQTELAAVIRNDLESGFGPDVRWMATTGDDCMGLVTSGRIAPELFGLFQHHLLRVPSLSERREDLPLLIVRLLEFVAAEQGKEIRGIELDTLNSLVKHQFSGEMGELLAELRRLVSGTPDGELVRGLVPLSATVVGSSEDDGEHAMSAAALLGQDDLKVVIPTVERLIIDRVLRRVKGNQSKAARILNLSRGALISKIKDYEIPDYRYLRRAR